VRGETIIRAEGLKKAHLIEQLRPFQRKAEEASDWLRTKTEGRRGNSEGEEKEGKIDI